MRRKINPILLIFVVLMAWGLFYGITHSGIIGQNGGYIDEASSTVKMVQTYNDIYAEHLNQNRSGITIHYQYDTKSNSWTGGSYQLLGYADRAQFVYYSGDEEIYCDFKPEKYDELKSLLLSVELRPYEVPSDENGKMLYSVEPIFVTIYDGKECQQYSIAVPSNIDRLEEFFENMKKAAQ